MAAKAQTPTKPEDKDPADPPPEDKTDLIRVSTTTGKPRRRAGMRFVPEGVVLDAASLCEDDRRAIEADPVLKIEQIRAGAAD